MGATHSLLAASFAVEFGSVTASFAITQFSDS